MPKYLALILLLALGGCDLQSREEVIEARMAGGAQLRLVVAKYQDAIKVAGSTGRIALAGPVGQLQAIRRELLALEVSECLRIPKENLAQSWEYVIDMLLDHMQNKSPNSLNKELASKLAQDFTDGFELCQKTPEEALEKVVERAETEAAAADFGSESEKRINRIIEEKREANPL
jgi:hypothetical protein